MHSPLHSYTVNQWKKYSPILRRCKDVLSGNSSNASNAGISTGVVNGCFEWLRYSPPSLYSKPVKEIQSYLAEDVKMFYLGILQMLAFLLVLLMAALNDCISPLHIYTVNQWKKYSPILRRCERCFIWEFFKSLAFLLNMLMAAVEWLHVPLHVYTLRCERNTVLDRAKM